jgi:methylenetetrahydrofolate dehydrogenase (NADP+)/methenyltetrahydrofolate cyclohydrolase
VILVGENSASQIYVRNKARASDKAGIQSNIHCMPVETAESDLLELVGRLNEEDGVDGILIQMPLPGQIDARRAIAAVDPSKDVDGFHPINVGRLWTGEPCLAPCTPSGIIELLDRTRIELQGKHAVVLGRSDIVGKPLAALLLRRHATVTICHSRTPDLGRVASRADILVAAVGKAAMVTSEFIKEGAVVIDVGINQVADEKLAAELFDGNADRVAQVRKKGYTLVGDVHPIHAMRKAGAFTPVPGGVGPLTIALLLRNTLQAAMSRRGSK